MLCMNTLHVQRFIFPFKYIFGSFRSFGRIISILIVIGGGSMDYLKPMRIHITWNKN